MGGRWLDYSQQLTSFLTDILQVPQVFGIFLVANNYVFLLTISQKENFNFRQYQVHVGYRHFWTEMSFLRNIFVTLFFNAMLLLSCYVLWCKNQKWDGRRGVGDSPPHPHPTCTTNTIYHNEISLSSFYAPNILAMSCTETAKVIWEER